MCPVEGWLIQPVWSHWIKPALGYVMLPAFCSDTVLVSWKIINTENKKLLLIYHLSLAASVISLPSLWCRECRVGKWVVVSGQQPPAQARGGAGKLEAGRRGETRGPPSPAPIQAAGVYAGGEGEPGLEATTTLFRTVF